MLDITQYKSDPGLLVLIDFDTIAWNFFIKTIKKNNFGNTFINYVKLLYNQPLCSVTNNGYVSNSFNQQEASDKDALFQPCCLSSVLKY